jgi:hypothetical protein
VGDNVLHRFTRPKEEPRPDAPHAPSVLSRDGAATDEGIDDHGAFGYLRGVRERAVCLELRKKTGNIVALNYGWIERFEFDPSEGITLHANGRKVRIKGRNLNTGGDGPVSLFQGIVRHRVPWVQEAERPSLVTAGDAGTVIDSIEW